MNDQSIGSPLSNKHEVMTVFHEYGDEQEQNPFVHERPCDVIHWFDPI